MGLPFICPPTIKVDPNKTVSVFMPFGDECFIFKEPIYLATWSKSSHVFKFFFPELYLVYPQGNYIRPADSKPYLVIGEVKYGKPILDRVITPKVSIGDASRCALISMDSTLKSDLTVGPPIDFAVIKKDEIKIASLKCLNMNDPEFSKVCNQWSQGIFKIFDSFQRFDWE